MNILYINHYAGSIYHGMEYRPYYLASEWVKQGHDVTIIASNFSHIRNQNVIIPNNLNYLNETIDGINYIWCKTKPYQGNGIKRVFNIYEFLSHVKRLIPDLLKFKPDIVIASSTYPFDTYVSYKIAKLANAKFIYEVHDLWPLTPIEVGGMSKYHPFIWLMQRAEDFGYKHADRVVSLLPCAKDYMVSHKMQADKFFYIPNGVVADKHLQNVDTLLVEHQKIISNAKNQFKLLVGYAGGMGDANALEYLIDAAKYQEDVAFILVGNGPNKSKLINSIKTSHLENVFILPEIKKSQIPDFLGQMDVLYIGWHKLPIYRFGICPNKLFDYMLAKRPILHSVKAGNDLVLDANCGISVDAEDVMAIVEAINKFKNLPSEQLVTYGYNGYNYVIKNHDYAVLAANFLKNIV